MRALVTATVHVAEGNPDAFRVIAQERRRKLAAVGCRYWLFEEPARRDRFLEFIEAADRETLARALAAELPGREPAPVWTEVDLS